MHIELLTCKIKKTYLEYIGKYSTQRLKKWRGILIKKTGKISISLKAG